jgi:hypothetical protein
VRTLPCLPSLPRIRSLRLRCAGLSRFIDAAREKQREDETPARFEGAGLCGSPGSRGFSSASLDKDLKNLEQ